MSSCLLFSPTAAPDALTMEDEFLTNAFNLLLDLLKGSTPKMHGSDLEHFRVSEIYTTLLKLSNEFVFP